MKFTDLDLSAGLQQRLAKNNFVTPTPIQEQSLPHALEGKDVLATSQTGSGKTLAFLIPAIEGLSFTDTKYPEVLVLLPTRELAQQVEEEYNKLRGKLPPAALIIGGVNEKRQIESLKAGARLIVATPGRLEDLLRRKLVNLKKIELLVLDEADRMLDMGFLPSIKRIIPELPQDRQTLCFSATLEASVAGLVHDYMVDPVRVAIGSTLKPASTVALSAYEVRPNDKITVLRELLYQEEGQTLIFARTKRGTERLHRDLARDGFSVAMIHGDRTQGQRNNALNGFSEGKFKVLVATDVASRGLHIPDVAHVINYDLPNLAEDFIHRVGRSGRNGASGKATTIVSGADMIELNSMEKTLKLKIERKTIDLSNIQQPERKDTLKTRTLKKLPGEVFV
jgi:ATP-dependent RNA helicase RhlE